MRLTTMASDSTRERLSRERLVPIKEAGALLPNSKNPPCYETIRQWTWRGVNGVILEALWIGKRMYTSQQAIDRFLDAIGDQHLSRLEPAPPSRIEPKFTSLGRRVQEKATRQAVERLRRKGC